MHSKITFFTVKDYHFIFLQFWKEVPQEVPLRLDCSDADSLFSSTGDEALSETSTVKAPSLSPSTALQHSPADTIILPTTSSNSSTSSPLSWLHDVLELPVADMAEPDQSSDESKSHELGDKQQAKASCSGSQPRDKMATLFVSSSTVFYILLKVST